MMLGNAVWESTLMRHVPDESLSRVSAYDWFGSLAFQPLGLAIWGPIAALIGISPALWVAFAASCYDGVAARHAGDPRLATIAGSAVRQLMRQVRVPSGRGCEHVFVPYVELHAHTAFSFLDGASSPAELAAAAVEPGHSAMAVVDHNGVSGSMEFALAAKPLGLRAIHGVEMDLEVGWAAARHAAGREQRGVAQPVPDRHARACARPRPKHEPPPAVPLETLEEHCAGAGAA